VQLAALRYGLEAVEMAARIMRQPMEGDNVRLAAIKEILDRGVGRAAQAVSLDLSVNKPLEAMSREELIEFRNRYAAVATASPLLIDQVLEGEQRAEQAELDLGAPTGEGPAADDR
jgi:hypothetical protein